MKLKSSLTIALLFSLLSVIGFAFIATWVNQNTIRQFDQSLIYFIQGLENPVLTLIMKGLTTIGSGWAIVVLGALVLFFLIKVAQHRSEWILFLFVLIGNGVLNVVLKEFFHRTRPDIHRLVNITGFSFPSGHSMMAFAFYGILSFLLWRHLTTRISRGILILSSILMILSIGMSRIYLGVHYPSDVIGGYLASGFWLFSAIWFYQYYKERRYQKARIHSRN